MSKQNQKQIPPEILEETKDIVRVLLDLSKKINQDLYDLTQKKAKLTMERNTINAKLDSIEQFSQEYNLSCNTIILED